MSLYRFKSNDVFYNRVKVNPKQSFYIYNGVSILNNLVNESGSHTAYVPNMPNSGYVSLYELNVDRSSDQLIYPFVIKGGSRVGFKTITTGSFNSEQFGTTLTSSYPLSASISKLLYPLNHEASRIRALKNTLNFYTPLSPAYQYDSSLGNKQTQEVGLLSIPSILYGSSIKKGTVDLKFYISGTLVGQLQDSRRNGDLIQVGPFGSNGSGSVAGVALYNEGFMFLTGTWDMTSTGRFSPSHTEDYGGPLTPNDTPQWVYFAQSISGSVTAPSSSFEISYEGVDYVQTITMLAHAPKGELNHSNNPTYVKYNANRSFFSTGSYGYMEPSSVDITNIASSSFAGHTASFKKITYISQIGIYDEDRNLIGIAKVATPVKKTEERDFTFKLKLDI
tara:strand:- start:24 stop:1199 length:1176 start_codon:yes stop_codon:yes gene_type:complete